MGPTLCVCPRGSGAIVRIEGEIDVCVADRVQQLLLRIMRMHGPRLLLDLSAVSFIDCAGLRAVMLTLRHAGLHGWSMHLIAASAMTRKMITLTGMEGVLPIRDQDGDSGTCASGEPEHPEYYMIDPSWIQCTRRRSPRAVTYRDE
jgi:anti-sigma B factor antagonist